jgi:tetratricopeptide (TPR) repeat protein
MANRETFLVTFEVAARLGVSSARVRQLADAGYSRFGLCVAYFYTGRLRDCLALAEEGLRLAQGDLGLGVDRLGISPSLALSALRGSALGMMGHLREGGYELDRVIELARTSQQLFPVLTSHCFHVYCCEVTGEVAAALAHSRDAVDCAERIGSPLGIIFAYGALGIANILNRAWHNALEVLEKVLAVGRERRLQTWESRVLASMAAAHLGLGDRAKALALAREAIAVSHQRGNRSWEFSAPLTRIRALREIHGVKATREIEAALAEAEAWLEMSGAKSPSSTSSAPNWHGLSATRQRTNASSARRIGSSPRSARRSARPMSQRNSAWRPPHEVRQKPPRRPAYKRLSFFWIRRSGLGCVKKKNRCFTQAARSGRLAIAVQTPETSDGIASIRLPPSR